MKARMKISRRGRAQIAVFTALAIASTVALTPSSFAKASGEYVTFSSFDGQVGSVIQVSGGNFTPNTTLSIAGTSGAAVSAQTDANGNFGPIAYTIPSTGSGSFTITASDSTESAMNSYYVQPYFPSVSLSAGSANPLSNVSLSGSGFMPNESVAVVLAGTTTTTTADNTGAFTGVSLSIPNVAAGTQIVTATGQTSEASATAYLYVNGFFPSVSPSSYYLLPGQTLGFTGSGFAANEVVDVNQVSGTTSTKMTSFSVDATGSFTDAGGIVIPFSAANQNLSYTLVGETSQASASASVSVGQFFANVSPSAYYIMPGQSLSFTGSGFAADETVNLTEGTDTTVLATITTDATGSFKDAGTVTVPFNVAGTNPTYHLVGSQSLATSDVQITVGQLYPTLSPSSWYLLPGSTYSATGSGFLAGETVDLSLGGTQVATATADALGGVSFSGLTFPTTTKATLALTITGETSLATTTDDVAVGQYYPYAVSSNYYAQPGTTATISGGGFAPNEQVTVAVGGTTQEATTDQYGNLTGVAITVPFPASSLINTADVVLTGQNNDTVTLSLTLAPFLTQLSPSNYYANAGSTDTLTGTGFLPGETVTFSQGTAVLGTATADLTGDATFAVTVPFAATSATYSAIGATTNTEATVSIGIAAFYPTLGLSNYYANAGSTVTITGSGYAPGETVTFSQGTTVLGTATVDAMGNVSFPVTLPYAATSATYSAIGSETATPATITAGIAPFNAGISLSNYYANGGSNITINGSGYAPGEIVTVTWAGQTAGTATADTMGNFSLPYTVPYAIAGTKTVVATGNTSAASASTSFTEATVYVSLQLGSYAGAPGTAVNFIGTGYMPGETIDITTDRTTGTVYSFTADSSGSFNDSGYLVPADFAAGNLTLTATGEESQNAQSIVYYVTGQ